MWVGFFGIAVLAAIVTKPRSQATRRSSRLPPFREGSSHIRKKALGAAMNRCIAPLVLCVLATVCMLAVPSHYVKKVEAVCPTCPPPPPPPPTVGEFGGPLAGLSPSITNLFNGGYGNFVIKWDPIRGLGPVSTKTGCFTCHGTGTDVLTGTAGDTSTNTGTRFGKWNPDNTFNYLDGNGTSPENEGGPVLHGISNATFQTLPGCSQMKIASNGATESGT